MRNKGLLLSLTLLLIISILILAVMFRLSRRSYIHSTKNKNREPGIIKLSTYQKLYFKINSNPILRQQLSKIYTGIAELSIYADVDIRRISIQLWILSNFLFLGSTVAFAIMFRNIILVMLCIIFAGILKDSLIQKKLTEMHNKLLIQEGEMLSSLRQSYIRLQTVTGALADCECGNLIKRPIEEIYSVLTSKNVQERLNEFYESCPLKTLQTLAAICYATDNTGDIRLPNGTQNFTTALSMIGDEVRLEIRGLTLKRSKFKSLEFLPIVPIFSLPLLKWFFTTKIPGTKVIYNGQIGFIFVITILLLAMIGYKVILAATSDIAIKYDDRSPLEKRMLKNKKIQNLILSIRPKSGKSYVKAIRLIRSSMSRLSLDCLYLRKLSFCSFTFIGCLIIIITSLGVGYNYTYKNVSDMGLLTSSTTEEEEEKLLSMDKKYFSGKQISDDERLKEFIILNHPGLKSNRIEEQVNRIRAKEEALSNIYFKWWHLGISFILAFIAWQIPNLMLKFRTLMIRSESEEDCLQLQTVIGILMHTSIDTLDLLDWLGKHSKVFKPIIVEAYHSYPSDAFLALQTIKYKSGLADFRKIIDKLMLTVSQISIAEAFSDVGTERDHLLRMREMSQEDSILRKRQIMSLVATAPLGATISLYFVLPIAIVGITELGRLLGGSGLIL